MKKLYILLCALIGTGAASAQINPGMETWRNSTSGTAPVFNIHAPTGWYGFDSLVIADGESFGALAGFTTDFRAQLYQENTIVHSGTSSAKVMTLAEDSLGFFAGIFANAQPNLDVSVLIGGGDFNSALTFSGGTNVTDRITNVSAWVEYFPGKDSGSTVMGGPDSGLITVQAISIISGYDSVVGTGTSVIPAHSTFTQINTAVNYINVTDPVYKVRIIFASSGGARKTLDSSTLYVDDVSMTGVPQIPLHTGNATANAVSVYPNPAANFINIRGQQNAALICEVSSVSGQVAATASITGSGTMDITHLPAGMYFYTITDGQGAIMQRGKVSVIK